MDSEIDLPPMPVSPNASSTPLDLSDLDHRRKRLRLEYDVATSSDPALFSSDDHAPTAEHYASERRKEQWRGTWWGEKFDGPCPNPSKRGKRKFTRNFDSGVYMGSEGTDTSLDDEFLEDARSSSRPAGTMDFPLGKNQRGLGDVRDNPAVSVDVDLPHTCHSSSQQTSAENGQDALLHAMADRLIERCLEAGDENVDLSAMSLESVSDKSLRRLRSLTKHTTIQEIPPSQDAYSPIEAALRLYLSNNSLSSFPSEILRLTNLHVLSLRHNKLTQIPPSVAELPLLEHLNIAGNRLKHLPYEMLHLCDRPQFEMVANPNPFEQAQHNEAFPLPSKNLIPTQRFPTVRSLPTYFEINGSKSNMARATGRSTVQSLLELALRKSQSLPDLLVIKDWCANGEGPETLSEPLNLAHKATSYGELHCTMCERRFVIPRARWIEWWVLPIKKHEQRVIPGDCAAIPFLRQACSWECTAALKW